LVDFDPVSLSEEFEHVGVVEGWNSRKGIFSKEYYSTNRK
jgi:hypothetical protein|tara:strand:- start:529 stop:648 length:120 start_codon:yes stop_codon:yes gene_type:complete